MSTFELFEFTFKFNLAAPETATWVYVILTLIFFLFIIGWGWGKMWNREWSLGGHVGSLIWVLLFGVLAAYSVFNLRALDRMENWFQQQRLTLARSISDSGKFNRTVLTSTWDQIVSKGGQKDLTPPAEGGNEIRLNTPEDAFSLASTAAEETRSTLRSKPPFSLGVPIPTRSPTDIATEAVDAVRFDASRFLPLVHQSCHLSPRRRDHRRDHRELHHRGEHTLTRLHPGHGHGQRDPSQPSVCRCQGDGPLNIHS